LIPTTRSVLSFVAGVDFPSSGIFLGLSSNPGLLVTNMTWSVSFSGMGSTDQVGVDLYSPPTVGGSYRDYWQNLGTGWVLMTNSVASMNFAAVLNAVPEPSSVLLGLLGGVGVLLGIRRFNRGR
jgi:hypothetical protein